jgi:transcriptional regulator of acetoin/glycerol metabolism
MPLQAALLRFLDDRLVRPVGGTASRRVDVQLLAASNADLAREVAERRFRADLLYRLDTVRVGLPPLRQRRDFAIAARQVLFDMDPDATLGDDAIDRLQRHAWPGNFRELRAVLARALLTTTDGHLDARSFDDIPGSAGPPSSLLQKNTTELIWREFERAGRSVSRTARCLGVSRTTVYRHLGEARAAGKR